MARITVDANYETKLTMILEDNEYEFTKHVMDDGQRVKFIFTELDFDCVKKLLDVLGSISYDVD